MLRVQSVDRGGNEWLRDGFRYHFPLPTASMPGAGDQLLPPRGKWDFMGYHAKNLAVNLGILFLNSINTLAVLTFLRTKEKQHQYWRKFRFRTRI